MTEETWYAAQLRDGHRGPIVHFVLRYPTIEEARAARDGLDCSEHDAVIWPPDPKLSPAARARLERDGVWKAIEAEVARRKPLHGGPEMVAAAPRPVPPAAADVQLDRAGDSGALLDLMHQISEDEWAAGWRDDLEFLLWYRVTGGHSTAPADRGRRFVQSAEWLEMVRQRAVCCAAGCRTQGEMRARHGDPEAFERALVAASPELSWFEEDMARWRYRALWAAAPR